MNTFILGAGVTGLSAALATKLPVFEVEDAPQKYGKLTEYEKACKYEN